MSFDKYKARPLQRFTSSLWNSVMDELNRLESSIVDTLKLQNLLNLESDIIPDSDETRNLGSSEKKWNNLYSKSGYFTELYVQDKPVLKDGDPITIADLSDTVIDKLSRIINSLSDIVAYTTTPLVANQSWTSSIFSLSGWGRIVGSVFSDKPGTLYVEQSNDGVNFDVQSKFDYQAENKLGFSVEVVGSTCRVIYANGPESQSVFRLYVRLRRI